MPWSTVDCDLFEKMSRQTGESEDKGRKGNRMKLRGTVASYSDPA